VRWYRVPAGRPRPTTRREHYDCLVVVDEEIPALPPTKPLRVLWVIKCLGYGGAERILVDMVAAVDRDRFAYEVAYVLRSQDALVSAVRDGGTPVHALGAGHDGDLRWMLALRRLLIRGTFDVVHFHLPYAAALGQLVVASLPRTVRPRVVYTEHSLWDRNARSLKVLIRSSMGSGQRLVTVSQASHDSLPPALRSRAQVVVHGVDLSRSGDLVAQRVAVRSSVRQEFGVGESEILFVIVANLRPEKGYDVLLEATSMLLDQGVPIRIVAAGTGPLSESLVQAHRDLGLGDHFQFLGQRSDAMRLLAGADAFVLPSRQEGLPVVLMEATSVGLPIVASDIGGVPQILTDGVDSLIVPPEDPVALAKAMSRLAVDPELRAELGRRAKERSVMFDITGASRAIGDLYETIVRPR
jgi:glycosyltransferase involved in cell wall biosynthesis